jgi:hypothetical protein
MSPTTWKERLPRLMRQEGLCAVDETGSVTRLIESRLPLRAYQPSGLP